jgi:hypothetical protein
VQSDTDFWTISLLFLYYPFLNNDIRSLALFYNGNQFMEGRFDDVMQAEPSISPRLASLTTTVLAAVFAVATDDTSDATKAFAIL